MAAGCTFPRCLCVARCTLSGRAESFDGSDVVLVNPEQIKGHGEPCGYCERPMDARLFDRRPTWDHIEPRSKGGSNRAANLIRVCRRCNWDKADVTLLQFWFWLSDRNDPRAAVVGRFLTQYKPAPGDEETDAVQP